VDCCKTLCPGACLVDGYLDNDFTIVMEKKKVTETSVP
jgi:hypothetical protein